jgi:hypothetical protein
MSTLIIPPGFANLTWHFDGPFQSKEATFSIGVEVADGVTNYDQLAQDGYDAFTSAWPQGDLSDQVALTRVTALVGNDGAPLVGEYGLNYPGNQAWTLPPPNVAVVMKKKTANAGVQYRGRCYLNNGFLSEAGVSNTGELDGGWRSTLIGNAGDFLTGLNAKARIERVVLLHSQPQEGAAPVPTTVTSFTIDAIAATQRRRLR